MRLSPIAFGVRMVSSGFSTLPVFINTIPLPVVTVLLQYATPISLRNTLFVALVSVFVRLRA